ncbi:MAG: hypothetical protein H7Y13_07275 [Sphingobacteriaceae bacterium]|nr:hypothetical protein [Sphingobacteriaceae bacterium]
MKRIILSTFAILFAILANAQSASVTLPQPVSMSFTQSFNNVKDVVWEKQGKKFKAQFKIDNVAHMVIYKDSGTKLIHQYTIPLNLLPKEVYDGAQEEFTGGKIEAAEKIENEGKTEYQLSIGNGDTPIKIIVSDRGRLIKNLSEEQ